MFLSFDILDFDKIVKKCTMYVAPRYLHFAGAVGANLEILLLFIFLFPTLLSRGGSPLKYICTYLLNYVYLQPSPHPQEKNLIVDTHGSV
jgi:hypothetical protein